MMEWKAMAGFTKDEEDNIPLISPEDIPYHQSHVEEEWIEIFRKFAV